MPAAPTNFALNEQAILHLLNGAVSNKSAASVTWTNNAAGAQHRIERQNNAGDWVNGTIAPAAAAAAIVGKLPNGGTANLRIRSEDNTGQSAWVTLAFATGSFATAGAPPSAPSGLAAGTITSTGATLTWEDNSATEAYFVIEVRHGNEVRERLVPGLTESHVLDCTLLFDAATVPDSVFTVRVKALGGEAKANALPQWSSAWTSEVTFRTLTQQVLIRSPLALRAEKGAVFAYTIATNVPCTAWTADSDPGTAGEQLPAGLARTDAVISGTITAAVGVYNIVLTASDGATTDTRTLVLTVVAGSFTIQPPLSAKAKLGVPFTHTLKAKRSAPGTAPVWTMANAPAWLVLDAAMGIMSGTPDEAGISTITVTATAGTAGGSATFTLTVPALSITSAERVEAFVGEPFEHQLTATSTTPPVMWEIVGAPGWLALNAATGKLTGTPAALGAIEVDVIAALDEHEDSQTLIIDVGALITVGSGGTSEIEGWEGTPLLEELHYEGPCEVEQWYLSGGPPGVEIGPLTCGGGYGAGALNTVAITGVPGASGFFDATITAHVCCGGTPSLHRFPVRFAINGPLFLAWLHIERTLYDLQFQVRGDILARGVRSWYGRTEKGAGKATTSITDTTTAGLSKTITEERETPAVTANLLTAKRGDNLRLALLLRDGRAVLTAGDAVTDVRLILRLPDAVDEDYLFALPATATALNGQSYYLVELTVTQEVLDTVMDANSVQGEALSSGPIDVLGEIHCALGGVELTSGTFKVQFVEDVER